jgi:hypothetical protein
MRPSTFNDKSTEGYLGEQIASVIEDEIRRAKSLRAPINSKCPAIDVGQTADSGCYILINRFQARDRSWIRA